MASLGVKLPLTQNSTNGFTMLKSIKGMIKQNFKMLVLTVPGERVMEPNYGVGLKTYLFSGMYEGVEGKIRTRLYEQVKMYMPIIAIQDIRFYTSDVDMNTLAIRITYQIPSIGVQDLLEFTI